MYKTYFKQAIEMLKQNKFISIISITGTALAIMMVMVIIVSDTIRRIDIAPEINRSKTYYAGRYSKVNSENHKWQSSIDFRMYKDYFSDLKTPEITSVIKDNESYMIKKDGVNERFLESVRMTDANFWKIMSFSFVDGKPFSQEEFDSGINNAIISESLAKKVFGNNKAVGKDIEIDFNSYKVTGVVKNVSQSFTYAYAEAYIPITAIKGYEKHRCLILILLNNQKDYGLLQKEFEKADRKYNAADPDWNMTFYIPRSHSLMNLTSDPYEEPDPGTARRKMIFIFTILLLIPAVNLSSFSMSRIKNRTEEIGVRKAFGARKVIIMIQVLYENFITALTGGLIGLGLSYVIVVWLKNWLLDIDAESAIPVEALVSIPVLTGLFIACFVLNLLSAGIPAYLASRSEIVDSINKKTL
ncbi:MAG: ABC transporter permease [Prevotella sp.]|jgi:putative ABC transport system permease protein|nr:ABC transporter permease [Prevotella sp.]